MSYECQMSDYLLNPCRNFSETGDVWCSYCGRREGDGRRFIIVNSKIIDHASGTTRDIPRHIACSKCAPVISKGQPNE